MEEQSRKENTAGGIRLNKYLSDAGVCSRREADRLMEAGRVTVDGREACPGTRVTPGQRVEVDGQSVEPEDEFILLAFHKPRGVVCTTDTRWGDRTIYDVLSFPKRVYSIGRLDKDSEGLLLLTNQGEILNKILRGGNYHEKEYVVTVNRKVTQEFLSRLSGGVYLEELGMRTRPCRVWAVGEQQFHIVLTQGLNRQIRRMCKAFDYRVVRLVRVRVMNVRLGQLRPGEYRNVAGKELETLLQQLAHD